METLDQRLLAALQFLLGSSRLTSANDFPAVISAACQRLGAAGGVVHVVDYDQMLLVPVSEEHADPAPLPMSVDATLAGRAFRDVAVQGSTAGGALTVWAPVIDGTQRLGVLELPFAEGVALDDALRDACRDLAALVAELLVTKSMYGDRIEQVRRRTPLTIPAELQWRLLPPLTFVSPEVTVAGVVAPSTEVAGDSFDYAVNADIAHVAILDAMGHGLEAALLATVAVGALRNARRGGLELADTVRIMDAEIAAYFGPDKFVTAIVGELNVRSGMWRWVTCGHPAALVVRGGRVVKSLDSVIGPPLGLGLLPDGLEVGAERLEPGDRLLLHTDGMIEARDANGNFFGSERLVEFITKESAAGRPAAETLRRLTQAILAHQEGALQDDATTVMVEWLTDQPRVNVP